MAIGNNLRIDKMTIEQHVWRTNLQTVEGKLYELPFSGGQSVIYPVFVLAQRGEVLIIVRHNTEMVDCLFMVLIRNNKYIQEQTFCILSVDSRQWERLPHRERTQSKSSIGLTSQMAHAWARYSRTPSLDIRI